VNHTAEPNGFQRAWARLETLWAQGGLGRDRIVADVVGILHGEIDHFDWVGIYVLTGKELHLHSQCGRPTPHETIAVGEGICGAAMAANDTIVVPDVNADERYLACNLETKSEIVVPVRIGRRPVAQIDIDSDQADAFGTPDRRFLEAIAARIAPLFADTLDTLPPTKASFFT
jgi:L-methionine (R)-S-oxide reductase